MSLKEKLSCSVRVPATIKVTEITLQAEVMESWLCYVKRCVYPIMTIYLDPARRENLGHATYGYPVCVMYVNLKKIQELREDCFVKMKVKRGLGTMRKKAVDARHLIQCLKEHRDFGKIHINLDVSSFHPLTFELKLKTKGLQEANEEFRNPPALEEKLSCSVRVPTTIKVTEITLQAQVIQSWLCYAKKFVFPFMTIYLDPARRENLPGEAYGYPVCCMHVDLKKIQELKADCFVKMKVKRDLGTMRKKAVDARHLIQCLKEHRKFAKIHIHLDVSSFHPLSFKLKIKVKELQQPKEFHKDEGKEELTTESVLPAAVPASLTSSLQIAGNNAGCNESNEAGNAIVIKDDMTEVQQKFEDIIETSTDKSECEDENEDLKEDRVKKESDECKESEDLKESGEWEDVGDEWEVMSDEWEGENGEWEDMSDEWEDMSDEWEDVSDEWEDMSDEWEGESEDAPLDTSVLGDERRRGTEEGQNARPPRTSRWHDLYHAAKRCVWRALVVQAVLFTVGAILEPYIPEVEDVGWGF